MKKIMMLTLVFVLIGCASTESTKRQSQETREGDFAVIISQTVLKNADKLPGKKVAVLDFTDINGASTEEGKLLAEQVTSRLAADGAVLVIERSRLDKVLKEQELAASGVTESTEEELGSVLNADALVAGTLVQMDENEEVNARMIDAKTGEIYCAANARKSLKSREKELEGLPSGQKEKISRERKEQQQLKKNDKLFAVQEQIKKQLWKLKEKDLPSFHRVLKLSQLMDKLKAAKPRVYLAVTAPEGAPLLEKIRYTRPEEYQKIQQWRKGLAFIIEKVPAYKNRIRLDRQKVITGVKGK